MQCRSKKIIYEHYAVRIQEAGGKVERRVISRLKQNRVNFTFQFCSYLIRISRISTHRVFIIDISNSEKMLRLSGVVLPNCDDRILPNRHRQHRISFIVNVLSDQVHSPYTPSFNQNRNYIHNLSSKQRTNRTEKHKNTWRTSKEIGRTAKKLEKLSLEMIKSKPSFLKLRSIAIYRVKSRENRDRKVLVLRHYFSSSSSN